MFPVPPSIKKIGWNLPEKSADTNFVHFVSYEILLTLKGRELHSRYSDLAELQTPIRCVYFVFN